MLNVYYPKLFVAVIIAIQLKIPLVNALILLSHYLHFAVHSYISKLLFLLVIECDNPNQRVEDCVCYYDCLHSYDFERKSSLVLLSEEELSLSDYLYKVSTHKIDCYKFDSLLPSSPQIFAKD